MKPRARSRASRRRSRAAAFLALALAACDGGDDGPTTLDQAPGFTIEVTVKLDPPREPFKVDGRLEAFYELAPPFAGERLVGLVVLPAGEASATAPLRLPSQSGRLLLREITFAPLIPFLCGSSRRLDPRFDRSVEIGVRLCIP